MSKVLFASLLAAGVTFATSASSAQAEPYINTTYSGTTLYITNPSDPLEIILGGMGGFGATPGYANTYDAMTVVLNVYDIDGNQIDLRPDRSGVNGMLVAYTTQCTTNHVSCTAPNLFGYPDVQRPGITYTANGTRLALDLPENAYKIDFTWGNSTLNRSWTSTSLAPFGSGTGGTDYTTFSSYPEMALVRFNDGRHPWGGTGSIGDWGGDAHVSDLALIVKNVSPNSPIPEPETYAMMLAGLGLIASVARRRRSRNS